MSTLIIVFSLYLLVVLVVGIIAARRAVSMESYFLADRSLGPFVAALSSVASSESGWIILGAVGMGYSEGISAVWFAPGCLTGYLVNWYLLAPRLRHMTENTGAVTIPDILQAAHDPGGRLVRIVAATIIFFCMMGYVGAQFSASGKSFEAIFHLPFTYGVLIGAGITVLYTLLGGFRAVAWTDTIQAALMAIGLVVMPIVLIFTLGGPSAVIEKMNNIPERSIVTVKLTQAGMQDESRVLAKDPLGLVQKDGAFRFTDRTEGRLLDIGYSDNALWIRDIQSSNPRTRRFKLDQSYQFEQASISLESVKPLVSGSAFGSTFGGKSGFALFGLIIGLLGIGLGYPGQPHVVSRFMALKDPKKIRLARTVAIVWGVLAYFGALTLGHLARISHPYLVDPEYAYPEVAMTLFPPVVAGLMLAAILSAIMSTADSQLLVAASAVTRDVYEKILGRGGNQSKEDKNRSMVLVSRLTILVLGALSILFALYMSKMVFWLVLFAWSGLGAAFGPLLLIGLWWPKVNRWGALAGMLTGFFATLIWHYTLKSYIYELVPAFILSAIAIVAVSKMTGGKTEDIDNELN